MNKRSNISRMLSAVAISSLYTFVILAGSRTNSAIAAITNIFGGAYFHKEILFFTLILAILPSFALLFFFTEYIQGDFFTYCIYVFTRKNSRKQWLIKKISGLFFWVVFFYFINYSIILIVMCFRKTTDDIFSLMGLCAVSLLLNSLSMLIFLIPMNIIATKISEVIAFLFGFIAYLIMLFATIFSPLWIKKWLCFLLPTSQGIYEWHDPLLFAKSYDNHIVVSGFSLQYSAIYLLIFLIIELLACMIWVRKVDLMGYQKGV